MKNDIRIYNYYDDTLLVNRQQQAEEYFDKKFGAIKDVDLTNVHKHIAHATGHILETIEDSNQQINQNLASKENLHQAMHSIISNSNECERHIICKIESAKKEIKEDIEEKFVNLNDLVEANNAAINEKFDNLIDFGEYED